MSGFDPGHIAISRSGGIKIHWKDGHHSRYELDYLRDHCPCASCAGRHGSPRQPREAASPFPLYKPRPQLRNAEPVGNYALKMLWEDGHDSGIFTFEHLRRICPCPDCLTGL